MNADIYVETSSGTEVHFMDPQLDEIHINDIAHALANLCRFNGHGAAYYSVAEHSVAVALRLPVHLQLAGLLHDASEAYLSDIPSPVKANLTGNYVDMEKRLQQVINEKFGITDLANENYAEIKRADIAALRTEAHYLIPSRGLRWFGGSREWHDVPVDHHYQPACLPPNIAYSVFMAHFKELTKPKLVVIP